MTNLEKRIQKEWLDKLEAIIKKRETDYFVELGKAAYKSELEDGIKKRETAFFVELGKAAYKNELEILKKFKEQSNA